MRIRGSPESSGRGSVTLSVRPTPDSHECLSRLRQTLLLNMLIFTIEISYSFHIWQVTNVKLLLNVCARACTRDSILMTSYTVSWLKKSPLHHWSHVRRLHRPGDQGGWSFSRGRRAGWRTAPPLIFQICQKPKRAVNHWAEVVDRALRLDQTLVC